MEQIKSAVVEVIPQKVIAKEGVRRVKYLSMDGLLVGMKNRERE